MVLSKLLQTKASSKCPKFKCKSGPKTLRWSETTHTPFKKTTFIYLVFCLSKGSCVKSDICDVS